MNWYRYNPDSDRFGAIILDRPPPSYLPTYDVVSIHSTDEALASVWTPLRFERVDGDPPEQGDFPSLSDFRSVPVMSERAWEVLHPIIADCCEPLPIIHPTGDPFFIIHVMRTIDALDEERSELSRNPVTNRVSRVFKYAFKTDLLRDAPIFKLPRQSGGELLVNDDFRRVVEDNGLKGLLFRPLPLGCVDIHDRVVRTAGSQTKPK